VGFDAHRPLLFDFLIVDEASMMDIHLWDTLLQAIKPTTSIIFLGDPDQLESIQPGRVLGSLVSSAESGGIVSRAFVKLTENFRFKKRPLIGILADAASPRSDADFVACLERVREQDVNQVERMVSEDFPSRADESRHDRHEIRKALQTIFPALEKLGRSRDPKAALDAIGEVRILCAVNQGRFGVSGLNAEVEKLFASVGESAVTRPILIRENDPTTGLFNGDLGVVIESTEGRASKAYFYRGKKMVEFSISKLPEHETAWAMTVHRSQGSEYRTVLLVLPPVKRETATEDKLEFMGKELLFTAITRAKEKVIFLASDERLKSICQRQEFRRTGLPERLKV
jgi:exodeoxyribonuclease V alpha subunit